MSDRQGGARERKSRERFRQRYGIALTEAHAAIELEAIGGVFGANGYPTVAQADALGKRLGLAPGRCCSTWGAGGDGRDCISPGSRGAT